VPGDEIAGIVAAIPSPTGDPERWWVLERAHHRLTVGMGTGRATEAAEVADRLAARGRGPWGPWPVVPTTLGPGWEWFHLHLFLSAVPAALRQYEAQGVDAAVAWATLGNIGRNVGLHRQLHGTPGVHAVFWLVLPARAAIFHVGRLQFLPTTAAWPRPGGSFTAGDPVLDIHIPPTGPLHPDAVDRSYAAARALFARALPAADSAVGVCSSWLLDPQLRAYLPADSNILRFQDRFEVDDSWAHTDDASTIEFVFRRPGTTAPADLPRRTTLERAIVDHLRAGGHWQVRRGWCRVPAVPAD
jgi:hypothetical protein